MVYHGRLDEHRGLMAAVMFTHKARQAGIQVNLKMIGEGNIETKLERIAAEYDYIEMKPKMHQSKVAQEIGLATSDSFQCLIEPHGPSPVHSSAVNT